MAAIHDTCRCCAFALAALPLAAMAAGKLDVHAAWIRSAPPGAMMLAGYALLHNSGDATLVVHGARSEAFGTVALHESVESGGVERMRPLGDLTLAPNASVILAPGGKHLMLMQPARPLPAGSSVKIHFDTGDDGGSDADFVVRDDAPQAH